MKPKIILINENGSVLVIALIMLALLTVLGIMSTNTSSIDLQIAGNERIHRQNFNAAEAANMLAVQRIIDELDDSSDWSTFTPEGSGTNPFIIDCEDDAGCAPCTTGGETCTSDTNPFRDVNFWFDDITADPLVRKNRVEEKSITINGQDLKVYYAAQYDGEFSGASQVLVNADKLYKFTCYGLYFDPKRGEVLIETAMTRRF